MKILYHHTEIDSGVPAYLEEKCGTGIYKKWKCSPSKKGETDYQIIYGDIKIGFERKEINDLVGSIADRKIPHQITKIIDAGLHPIFLVEGLLPDCTQSEFEWKSIYGFLGWLSECDATVHQTLDFLDTGLRILNIAKRVKKGDFKVFKVPVPIIRADTPVLQRLMGIEGVGEELAYKIQQLFKDNWHFLRDCEYQLQNGSSELMTIKGIGKEKADTIARDALRDW